MQVLLKFLQKLFNNFQKTEQFFLLQLQHKFWASFCTSRICSWRHEYCCQAQCQQCQFIFTTKTGIRTSNTKEEFQSGQTPEWLGRHPVWPGEWWSWWSEWCRDRKGWRIHRDCHHGQEEGDFSWEWSKTTCEVRLKTSNLENLLSRVFWMTIKRSSKSVAGQNCAHYFVLETVNMNYSFAQHSSTNTK